VAGSSSGAIVAAVLACFPHRIEEYKTRFLEDGGRALRNFQEMLVESSITNKQTEKLATRPLLHIATTNCINGSLKICVFDPNNPHEDHYHMILLALRASCHIPPTFICGIVF
jgi:predicted acylesterase/phospholipase RssA